jgi:predicted nucleotidyltransferase
MPNPRYLSREGEPTVELLGKMYKAKETYFSNLDNFCDIEFIGKSELSVFDSVYLIGSHAEDEKWCDETSDIDLKIVNSIAVPENLFRYKRKVLDKILCSSERKRDWIDLYFVKNDYQVLEPKWNLINYWNDLKLD